MNSQFNTVGSNEGSWTCTSICGMMKKRSQLNAALKIMYLSRTHGNKKLDLDYFDDEIRRAQNEIGSASERIEEYACRSLCSLELDSPV